MGHASDFSVRRRAVRYVSRSSPPTHCDVAPPPYRTLSAGYDVLPKYRRYLYDTSTTKYFQKNKYLLTPKRVLCLFMYFGYIFLYSFCSLCFALPRSLSRSVCVCVFSLLLFPLYPFVSRRAWL